MSKKRIISLCMIGMLFILIVGCSKQGGESDNAPDGSDNTELKQSNSSEETLSGVANEPLQSTQIVTYQSNIKADKKLVMVTYDSFISNVNPEIFDEMNRLLVEKYRCDFTVDIIGIPTDYQNYQDTIRRMKEQGEQVDIINTGLGAMGEAGTYSIAVQDGLLQTLTELLSGTDAGKELYQAFSSTFWEAMKCQGTIYGFGPRSEMILDNDILMNNRYSQKSTEHSNSITFDSMGQLIEAAMNNGEGIPKDVLPIYVNDWALTILEGYLPAGSDRGIYFKNVDGKWKLVNLAQEERIQEIWNKIREFRTDYGYQGLDTDTSYRAGKFYIAIIPTYQQYYNDNKLDLNGLVLDVTELASKDGYQLSPPSNVTGIASWSDYPEEAMEFLGLLETKADLANLLTYGIEGEYYNLEDGCVQALQFTGSLPFASSIVNSKITYPTGREPKNKTEVYEEKSREVTLSPQATYELNYDGYFQQLKAIQEIYASYSGLWNGEYENVNETIDLLLKELKNAGIEELLNYLNQQL